MPHQFILTPFTLGQATPGLATLARPGWQLTEAAPEGESQLERIGAVQRLEGFVALLQQKGLDRVRRLLSVPGAFAPKSLDQRLQIFQRL